MNARLRAAARVARQGGVIAYPTEAVWGLGCDPGNEAALTRLLRLKRRPASRGLILVAADWSQLRPHVALDEPPAAARASWPGPVTWLLPAAPGLSPLVHGAHPTVAVRISAHPPVQALCRAFGGALVSTSANRHGQPTAPTQLRLRRQFGRDIDAYVCGPLGGLERPSEIRDSASGSIVRS